MTFLIDTNVVSELRRSKRMDANVRRWTTGCAPEAMHVLAMTIFELELGAGIMSHRDAVQGKRLRDWIETKVVPLFAGRILPIGEAVARRAASLHVPNPRPDRDAFIAATALVHGLTVVTRNVRDFAALGVPLLNPWEAKT